MAKYVCKNFSECGKADAGEQMEMAPGTDPVCPECGSRLYSVESAGKFDFFFHPNIKRGVAATAVGIAVFLLGDNAVKLIGAGGDFLGKIVSLLSPTDHPQEPKSHAPGSVIHAGEPDSVVIHEDKKRSEQYLREHKPKDAELYSRRASAKEMIKTAIAYLDQNKLNDAETELASARQRDPTEPLIHYNIGVLRIKQGRNDDALLAFEDSFKNGFRAFDMLDQDRDLDPLRKDKRFRELLNKYRSANG